MTDDRLAELEAANAERRRRKAAATPGPWGVMANGTVAQLINDGVGGTNWGYFIVDPSSNPNNTDVRADLAFIAGARNDPVEEHNDELAADVRLLRSLLADACQESNLYTIGKEDGAREEREACRLACREVMNHTKGAESLFAAAECVRAIVQRDSCAGRRSVSYGG